MDLNPCSLSPGPVHLATCESVISVKATGLPPHLGHSIRTQGFAPPPTASIFGKKDGIKVAPLSPYLLPCWMGGDVSLTVACRLLLSAFCIWSGLPWTYLSDTYYVPGPMLGASLIVSLNSRLVRYYCSQFTGEKAEAQRGEPLAQVK